ncbi:S1C family serine protease [Falsiroseomonas sp. HW251]|uniref:S1C family serine protease n=1 Tax=Falsiroseomonas sp. HW251 TaxID=3390998 RepID=UPI003D321936
MPNILEQLSATLTANAAGVAASVVSIRAGRHAASGFGWRDGLVVTADEALPDEGEVTVTRADGSSAAASFAGRDPSTDVALLRVDGVAPLPLDGAVPPAGALVQVVGRADAETLVALGTVARSGPAWRSLRGGQVDARVELGLSLRRSAEGGIALDPAGRAFGMAVFGPRRRTLVIPAATIARVAATLAEHGRIARGWLGLSLQPVPLEGGAGVGLMVMAVEPGGPAASAIVQGDVVVAIDGRPIEGMRGLMGALGPASVGTRLRLGLRRAGAPLEAEVTVAERPAG